MNDLKILMLIAVFAIGRSALAESPPEPNQGSGTVASNAGVSLDSDSPVAEQGEAIGSVPSEPRDEVTGASAVATGSPRVRGERSVLLSRSVASDVAKSDVPRASWSWLTSGLLPLMAVLGVMGAAYWAVRRWVPAARSMDAGVVRVVSRAGLTPKHTVALLHVGRRFVLVGVSGDRIQRLETIDNPEEVADLLAATQSSGVSRGPFLETLEEESSSYVEAVEELEEPSTGTGLGGARASEQLGSLLKRLRRLQKS